MSAPRGAAALLCVALALTLVSGCGPSCQRIADARAAFRRRPVAPRLHGELLVPLALGNRLLAKTLDGVRPKAITLPGLGQLAAVLGKLEARPTRVRLVPAPQGRLGLEVAVELSLDGERALDLELATALAPRLESTPEGRRQLVFALDAESLRGLTPKISPGSARRLAKLVYHKLPRMLRLVFSEGRIAGMLRGAIAKASSRSYRWLRGPLGRRLGQHKVRIALPPLPLAKAIPQTRTHPIPHLAVALHFALPVRRGLPHVGETLAPSPLPLHPEQPQLRLAGSALAEIGNWAMDKGLVPKRYDRKLAPKKKGGVRPILDWIAADERPLKVHVFRSRRPCAHLRLGAKADVSVVGPPTAPKLRLRVGERKVEQVRGSVWIKLGVFFDQLWSTNLAKTKEHAAGLTFRRGGKSVSLRLAAAKLTAKELVLAFAVTLSRRKVDAVVLSRRKVDALASPAASWLAPTSLAGARSAAASPCARSLRSLRSLSQR